tara:strand:+ start:1975 stop:2280 length:306 start_codon:yes stop_codon:yes gene_type:complete
MRDSFTLEKQYTRNENSFGQVGEAKVVTMKYNISFNEERQYGSFELYDLESGGDEFYSEGGLWFEENELVDYDGIFCLPTPVLDKLEEWGLNVSDMRESLK